MKVSKRQNAKERRMERRAYIHHEVKNRPVRVIARRVSYISAVAEVRMCRHLRPDCRFIYIPSASGHGYNVIELLGPPARGIGKKGTNNG